MFTTVFPNNGVRDAHRKQATQGLSCKQNSCERDQENAEIKQYENLPQKIPCYSGVSKKYFCSKRFRYLGSESVKVFLYYCWVFADFRLKNLAKRIKFSHWRVTYVTLWTTLYYEQLDNNRFCTCRFCSSLWFVKQLLLQ